MTFVDGIGSILAVLGEQYMDTRAQYVVELPLTITQKTAGDRLYAGLQ